MKNRTHSLLHRALTTVAFVLFITPFLWGQESFLYQAYTEAWMNPESFDEYVAEHRGQFNDDLNTCATQIRDYFSILYDRAAQLKALCPEKSQWHADAYVAYLHAHPGVGMGIMIDDMNRVASGKYTWEETVTGKATLWLHGKLRQEVFAYKQMNYLRLETALGTDMAEQYMAEKWRRVLEPLRHYLKDMEAHMQCYYY